MGGQIPSNPFADHRYSQAQRVKRQPVNHQQQPAQGRAYSNNYQPQAQSTQPASAQQPNQKATSPAKAPADQKTPWLRHIAVFLFGVLLITASSYATRTSRTIGQWNPETAGGMSGETTSNEEGEEIGGWAGQIEGQVDEQNGEQGAIGRVTIEQNAERTAEASIATESEFIMAGSDYQVTINGARLVRDGLEDDEGESFIVVDYTFANISHAQPIAMNVAVRATACQEGAACEHAVGGWSRGWDDSGYMTNVEMGSSVNVSKGYALRSMANDIVIEVKDYSDSTETILAQQTFSIAELQQ